MDEWPSYFPDRLLRIDSEGLVREAAGGAVPPVCHSPDAGRGPSLEDALGAPLEGKLADAFEGALRGEGGEAEYRAGGRWFEARFFANPKGGAWLLVRDITGRRMREEARQKELREFVYAASHDLAEPLRKIIAFGDRLASGWGEQLDEQGCDYLSRMRQAALRMNALIDGLLSLSRVTTRGEPFEPVALGTLLDEVLADLDVRIEETGGRVTAGPLPTLEADRVQMRQLFQNLVGNALKFHHPDRPPLVEVRAETTDAMAHIEVCDNGIGFDAKEAERIFQPFQRLHGRSAYDGAGIGLAVCRGIVERHHGAIRAEGRSGEGACFRIELPLLQPQEDTHGN